MRGWNRGRCLSNNCEGRAKCTLTYNLDYSLSVFAVQKVCFVFDDQHESKHPIKRLQTICSEQKRFLKSQNCIISITSHYTCCKSEANISYAPPDTQPCRTRKKNSSIHFTLELTFVSSNLFLLSRYFYPSHLERPPNSSCMNFSLKLFLFFMRFLLKETDEKKNWNSKP